MEIKDVQANQGNLDLVLEVVSKEEPRTFEKFGKQGRVCKAKVKDATGEVTLTLWNDDVDAVSVGDKVHLQNGWCSEYQGERQLSSGKFGKLEVVEKAAPQEVFTNSAEMLSGAPLGGGDSQAPAGEEGLEQFSGEEELVE